MDSKDGGVSHTRAESKVLATSGHKSIGVLRYWDIRILRYQDIGISGYWGFGVGRLAGLAELAGLLRLVGLASWQGWRRVMVPGGESWCQEGGHGASQMSGCQAGQGSGVIIGKDDGVTMVISLFYPGKVHGVGHGISVDAGYQR